MGDLQASIVKKHYPIIKLKRQRNKKIIPGYFLLRHYQKTNDYNDELGNPKQRK